MEWLQRALGHSREDFAEMYPYPFLLATVALVKPPMPRPTEPIVRIDPATLDPIAPTGERSSTANAEDWIVLPLRKVQDTFPTMITVGRTANNDVVINDITVSKFHAFFQAASDGALNLYDAGSRNGTWVGGKRVPPRGRAQRVALGDHVRFGEVPVQLLGAGGLWDALRRVHMSG